MKERALQGDREGEGGGREETFCRKYTITPPRPRSPRNRQWATTSAKTRRLSFEGKFASRPVDVRRAMLDYEPNIVHFCGHGGGQEGIAFEDEQGQAKLISTEAISGFFQLFSDKVECVISNACYSDVQAKAISEYIPFVVGMRKGIGDSAAIEFAVAFYDALGAGKTIDFAFRLACNAIQWAGLPEHLTPMIHVRADRQIGQVLPFESPENPRKEDSLSLNLFVTGGIEVSQEVAQVAFMIGQCVVLRGHTLLRNGSAGVDKLCGQGAFTACPPKI